MGINKLKMRISFTTFSIAAAMLAVASID